MYIIIITECNQDLWSNDYTLAHILCAGGVITKIHYQSTGCITSTQQLLMLLFCLLLPQRSVYRRKQKEQELPFSFLAIVT